MLIKIRKEEMLHRIINYYFIFSFLILTSNNMYKLYHTENIIINNHIQFAIVILHLFLIPLKTLLILR